MLAAMLAMVLIIAAPAMGQVSGGSGDFQNVCGAHSNQNNSGNINDNEQTIDQTNTTSDDNEINGPSMQFDSQAPVECGQSIDTGGSG
jgi:hypothetical protein